MTHGSARQRNWVQRNGLLVANLLLFVIFLVAMTIFGAQVYSDEQVQHGQPPTGLLDFVFSGDFVEATFENWESEFLQMGMYVILTAKLITIGSSESKPVDEPFEGDEDPHDHRDDPDAPGPVRRGGWVLAIYQHSLTIWFVVIFVVSLLLHAVGGAAKYSAEELQHGGAALTWWQYLGTSQFWFESMQNWQSEFLAVAAIVGASIWLRERGSAESKPVHAPHHKTGA